MRGPHTSAWRFLFRDRSEPVQGRACHGFVSGNASGGRTL
jgi:hypothetical protein